MRVQHSSCAQVQKRVLVFCCFHGSTVQFLKKAVEKLHRPSVTASYAEQYFFFFDIVPFSFVHLLSLIHLTVAI